MDKQIKITTDEPFYCESILGINDFWSFSAQKNGKHWIDTYCDTKNEAESLKTYLEAMPDFAKLMDIFNTWQNMDKSTGSPEISKQQAKIYDQLEKYQRN
ncbi:hypothetical protein [Lysinibacillus pakistanensis]|uniref:Uncharacterized protein n=1 Tax=Lysinibacillus pakistanensis TaxID=759811 RepID=A0ABX6DGY2_9BACI|nr:hypothetical protein GDS87_24470 [Lysinibacillus pakistanensis]QGG54133.1 hypothetical protein GDS87_24750 [Lysinibacillus pakistanensis]